MSLKEILGIKYPIIQGGMARISRGNLASAVANAGGLGLVGTGGLQVEEFRDEIRIAKSKVEDGKVFGVNIVLMEPNVEEKIQVALDEEIGIFVLAAGNPAAHVPGLLEKGKKVITVVANAKMAKKAESLGVTAVVFEGMEDGGHIGSTTTMAMLPQVVKAVNIPVLSAGGIATGAQILAAQVLGAQGVQMGTRFLVADETAIHENFKQAVIDYEGHQTDLTGGDHPVRQLSNEMTQSVIKLEKENAPLSELEKYYTGSLSRAVYDGDVKLGSMMAGQSVGLVNKRDSVAGIFKQLTEEYQEAKKAIGIADDLLY